MSEWRDGGAMESEMDIREEFEACWEAILDGDKSGVTRVVSLIRSISDQQLEDDGELFAVAEECLGDWDPQDGGKKSVRDLLQALAQFPESDGYPFLDIRTLVAENPHTPEESLRALAQDDTILFDSDGDQWNGSRSPRAGVAQNTSAPEELLRDISLGAPIYVAWRLAGNPSTPPDVLEALLNRALNDPEYGHVILGQWDNYGLAQNPSSTPGLRVKAEEALAKR